MKKILLIIISICALTSCMTPSQCFLANKHEVNKKDIKIILEEESKTNYSPLFDLEKMLISTNRVTVENFDSLKTAYQFLNDNKKMRTNCTAYNVLYQLHNDTLSQTVFFINKRTVSITHDNDIINRMHSLIRLNLNRFQRKLNKNENIMNHEIPTIII